ncbi:thiamine pyrophosphate-binding protein [Nocardiopsis sp. JB363]|uniref:thiamine pyrophosphate-binding protein n=1 Tax=Nocardiopsis sp. JB363 TaxID=1434837 RepID=UPI00097AEC24|nr:thiamine pyrophosphate-binding protein [Nocardiopsis sp. JB363]SIO88038.1 TPP-requiring enzyme co-localized with fatty acid metabolic genes [Nocardiopsis sp. JB363]
MIVADLVGRTLAQLGAGHVFGVVGSGNFDVTNALRRHGVPFTAARHEGGAAVMADAYARMSNRPGVLTLHQGCGLTNALTGIGEAAKSRTPLLVLAADTAPAAVLSNFAVDQDALARAVGAVPERVHSAASAVADTVRAFRTAVHERRTVVLNLPLDVQAAPAPQDAPATVNPPPSPAPVRPAAESVASLVELVRAAERPVFVAGRGARGAGPQIAALAAHAGALLATSAVASGLFEGEEFSLGISGGFASPLAAELITDSDLIVGWGCALNMWTMRHGKLISSGTRVAQVDVESSALGAHRPIDLGVLGDTAATARDALSVLRDIRSDPATKLRTPDMAARITAEVRWNDVPFEALSTETRSDETQSTERRVDPRSLTIELDRILPRERVVAVDSGNFMGYPSAYLAVPDEFGFCFTQAFQSVGLGLGTAIGASYARPERLPVLATGDGGLLMAISELETAVRLGIPLVIVVYNDAAYGAEVHHFAHQDLDTVVFPDTDFAALARGYGASGVTVRGVEDLVAVSEWLEGERTAPLVVDAKVASDGGSWWLMEAFGH